MTSAPLSALSQISREPGGCGRVTFDYSALTEFLIQRQKQSMSQAPSDLLKDSNGALLRHILDMRSHESQAFGLRGGRGRMPKSGLVDPVGPAAPPAETRLLRGVIPL
ncbi:unnamed protein product [Arctogadus glacialis]